MHPASLRLLSCSWPRPVASHGRRWISEPEWNAPAMARVPACHTWTLDGRPTLAIDWRTFFAEGVPSPAWHLPGEMKEFHLVFRMRAERSGTLVFHDDDGSIIRRNGVIVHEDREVHPMQRHELPVRAGDTLEIAQWQFHADWVWAGRIESRSPTVDDDVELFGPFRDDVFRALEQPNGPVLKTYFSGSHPVRAALAVHSLVLNGYRPAGVHVYGEYQWDADRRRTIERLLPFAEIVPTSQVMASVRELSSSLVPVAQSVWAAMKICIGLFHPPFDYCFVDDDVFVLDRMDDALSLFTVHDLVYQADWDHGESYRRIWRISDNVPLATGNINTGMYFVRNRRDRMAQALRLARNPPNGHPAWIWEQGFMSTEFADAPATALPTQRYFYPIFDGLPGGTLGYDWEANPCGFATAHFGGLRHKPSDDEARALVAGILGRRRTLSD
jgi:hypothetical protein